MLEIRNRTPFEAAIVPGLDKEGADTLTVVVKGTFGLRAKGSGLPVAGEQVPIHHADVFHGEPGVSSIKYEADGCPSKRGTDIALIGHAYSIRPVPSLDVDLSVGALHKVVRIFGDRAWFQGVGAFEISRPQPWSKMPLVYERAFGGADRSEPEAPVTEPRNPIGTGFSTGRSQQQIEGLRLPNLEDPNQLIAAPTDRPPIAGFGFIGRDWAPRLLFAGTYDDAWRAERCPFLPADFNPRFFNAAPPDLVSPRHLAGGEPVRVTNASETGDLAFRIPAVALDIAISIKKGVSNLAPVLDTVLIEPDAGRLVLTWRATVPCRKSLLYVDYVRIREGARPA